MGWCCCCPNVLLLLVLLVSLSNPRVQAQTIIDRNDSNWSVSALLVFGDSTVDSGNNNNIAAFVKSNFPPYGKDLPDHMPTGRFTNGKLVTDFIASYLGVKEYVPPYLDATLSFQEMSTGVSFASGGSGYDPLTSHLSEAISMEKQLEYFMEYKKKIEVVMGKERMEDHIEKAVFVVSGGTNDFVVNYFGLPIRRKKYDVPNYQQFVLQNTLDFLQGLWDLGARRIGVVGLPPMGCLPIVITVNSRNAILQRGCFDAYTMVAKEYNQKLEYELESLQKNLANDGSQIFYADIYQPLVDMIQSPDKFGFVEWSSGCCGSGLFEAGYLCNIKSLVCPDASKYVFWDSFHPTEKAYYTIFSDLRHTVDLFVKK